MKLSTVVTWIVGAVLILLFSVAAYLMTAVEPQYPTIEHAQQVVETIEPPSSSEILKLVNEERAKVGVASLIYSEQLEESAQVKADDMAEANYFDHIDANGKQGYEYAWELEPRCKVPSENIRRNSYINTSEAAFNGWKSSKSHYEAMVNPDYTLTGIGISGTKIVQHFCIAR